MPTYNEDGPTAKAIRSYLARRNYHDYGDDKSESLAMILARAIDELREQTGVSEDQRLQEEAEKGYQNG